MLRLPLLCLSMLVLTPSCGGIVEADDDASTADIGQVEQALTYNYAQVYDADNRSECLGWDRCDVDLSDSTVRSFDCTHTGGTYPRGRCTYQTSPSKPVRESVDLIAAYDTDPTMWVAMNAACVYLELTSPQVGPTQTAGECYLNGTIFGYPDRSNQGYRAMYAKPTKDGRIWLHRRAGNDSCYVQGWFSTVESDCPFTTGRTLGVQ